MRAASLRTRLTLITIAAMSVLLVVVAAATAIVLGSQLDHDLNRRLEARSVLSTQLATTSQDELAIQLSDRDITAIVTRNNTDIVAGDAERAGEFRAIHPVSQDESVKLEPASAKVRATSDDRLSEMSVLRRRLADSTVITLLADTQRNSEVVLRLIGVEAVLSVIAMALIVATVGRLARRALNPLDDVVAVAERVARGERDTRLRPDRGDTDMGRLATSFDTMVDSLESSIDRAETSERTMRQFVADASHELRNPAAAIGATSEILLHGEHSDADREQLELNLVRDSQRLGRLIGDLLDVARLDDPASPLQARPVDLVSVAEDEVARARLRHPDVPIERIGKTTLAAEVEPDGIGRVVANLLDNGARHALRETTVTIEIDHTLGVGVITVTNDGPEIADKNRERIFERFTRLDTSRTRAAGGSGLGLSISRSIARRHGGSLRCVDAPEGRGARFELRIPLQPRSPMG